MEKKDKKKAVKKIAYKKLPGLFKKNYSPKKFEKKLIGHIYIEQDRELVKKIFTTGVNPKKPDYYGVNKDSSFTEKDLAALKRIAVDLKSYKGRIRLLPLVALVSLVAVFIVVVGTFKNPIAKKIIRSACESIFSAKTDIASVDVQLLNGSVSIKGLDIGNKNDEFKNLFHSDSIVFDFNLTHALRGKVDVETLNVTGVALGTDRTTSCRLPVKEKKEKKQKDKAKGESDFVKSITAKKNELLESIKAQSAVLLGGGNAEEIIKNIQNQLKTPQVSKEVSESVVQLSDKWRKTPGTISVQLKKFSDDVTVLQKTDPSKIQSIEELKSYLEKVNSAINTGNALKDNLVSVKNNLDADSQIVSSYSVKLNDAILQDQAFAREKINAVTDTVSGAKALLNDGFGSIGYALLGNAYPYVKKGIDVAVDVKKSMVNQNDKKAKSTQKKNNSRRLKGTDILFVRDAPGFLIRNAKFSGFGFTASVSEITSNQDIRNKPMTCDVSYSQGDLSCRGNLVFDARSNSDSPLIEYVANISGVSVDFDGKTVATLCGVPSATGKAVASFRGSAGENVFSAKGDVSLVPVSFTSDGFENALATKYYNVALSSINKLNAGFDTGYNSARGVWFNLSGNFADSFVKVLSGVASAAGSDAKVAAFKAINDTINSSSSNGLAKIAEFLGIQGDITAENANLESLQTVLKEKQLQFERELKAKSAEAVSKTINQALDSNPDAKKAIQNLESAGNLLKGLKK